jgi:GntR family transcriptional regulator
MRSKFYCQTADNRQGDTVTTTTSQDRVRPLAGRNHALPVAVRNHLRQLIDEEVFASGAQLPTEPDLARSLGVSRVTLRQALHMLQDEGVLLRRSGLGTFVAERPWLQASLDVNYSLTALIEASGRRPGTVGAQAYERPADAATADALQIAEGSPVVVIERVRTADGRPVAHSVDTLPYDLCPGDPLAMLEEHGGSLHRLFRDRLDQVIHHGRARIRAQNADDYLASQLGVPGGSPLILLEQTDYNERQVPLAVGHEHVVTDLFELWIYRRGPGRDDE